MKKTKVIKRTNLPARGPWALTAICYLLLDKFNPSGIIVGIVWTLVALVWIAIFITVWNEDDVDVLDYLRDRLPKDTQ